MQNIFGMFGNITKTTSPIWRGMYQAVKK
jgi:hypothetical protein